MKKFVENETVQRVFKEVALSRPCLLEGCEINNIIVILSCCSVALDPAFSGNQKTNFQGFSCHRIIPPCTGVMFFISSFLEL